MQYYRCRCGKMESIGSMPPSPCQGCEQCNTSLETHPDNHKAPAKHDFRQQPVETDEGTKQISRCRFCCKTRKELEPVAK